MSDEERNEREGVRRDYVTATRRDSRRVQRQTDMGLSEAFESLKGKNGGYISDKKFLNGWVRGTRDGLARITLFWTDGNGTVSSRGKRGTEVYDFEHYFWMRTEDIQGRVRSLLRRWKDGFKDEHIQGLRVRRWEEDPDHPQWSRVYVDTPPAYFHTRKTLQYKEGRYVSRVRVDGKDRRISWRSPSHSIAIALEDRGIKTYEADLHPLRRFVADQPIRYPTADEFSEFTFDIETDDRHDDLFENLGKYRILSIVWEDKHGAYDEVILPEETDDAERNMLMDFKRRCLDRADVLFSWNGFTFDYIYIFERMRRLGIRWRWWRTVLADLLPVFKRYHFRAGSGNTSFALDAISRAVLGDAIVDGGEGDDVEESLRGGKIDLVAELDRRHPGWRERTGSSVGTYAAWWLDPDLLLEYNRRDVTLARLVESDTGYAHLDFTFSAIGNCFANDFHISTKIDGLMVRKGLVDGYHFDTIIPGRYEGDGVSYVGGYVHEPERGIHADVCAYDFKSLYPSMMCTFNISPDSYVHPKDYEKYDPSELITTPIGTRFLKPRVVGTDEDGRDVYDRVGFVPQMFAETLERRKTYSSLQSTVEVGSPKFLHYYRLSYAYKRLGLSFYGELGNRRGRFYAPEVGRSVTLCGQFFTRVSMEFGNAMGTEAENIRALYGDTDSIYIQIPRDRVDYFVEEAQSMYYVWMGADLAGRERISAGDLGVGVVPGAPDPRLVALLDGEAGGGTGSVRPVLAGLDLSESGWEWFEGQRENWRWYEDKGWNVDPLLSTIFLEYEDVYQRVCLINKKRYFGRMVFHKGEEADHLEIKGLESMRSDGLELARILQREVMDLITPSIASGSSPASGKEVWDHVVALRDRVFNGDVETSDLVCVAGLGKNPDAYKTLTPHVKAAIQLRDNGAEWYVGMKVRYIWTKGTHAPRPVRKKGMKLKAYVAAYEAWQDEEARLVARRSRPPAPVPVHEIYYDPLDSPYDAEYYWNQKVYPPSLRILEVAFPDFDWASLDSSVTRRRDREARIAANRLGRYRKRILSPRSRERAISDVRGDAKLSGEARATLEALYASAGAGLAKRPEKAPEAPERVEPLRSAKKPSDGRRRGRRKKVLLKALHASAGGDKNSRPTETASTTQNHPVPPNTDIVGR